MTTSADDNDHETTGPVAAFVTPDGIFTDAANLPPLLREALVATLDAPGMDTDVRSVLAEALGIEETDSTSEAAPAKSGARSTAWDLLDAAFPTEPHLWSAGEALLTASTLDQNAPGADARRAAIDTAIAHLERYRSHNEPPLDPRDALVAKFRDQMGGL